MSDRPGRVVSDITVSVDGYAAGLHQTEERPFGDDGGDGSGAGLHAWMFDTPDENRGEVQRSAAAKAFIMGRNMFGPVRGEWDRRWNGWWGDDPPFHAPVFVLTHHAREPQPMEGGTTFHFVTDGIEAALERARRGGRRRRRPDPGQRHHREPVPRSRSRRRTAAAHRARHAGRRHPAVRGRAAPAARTGGGAAGEPGDARDLPGPGCPGRGPGARDRLTGEAVGAGSDPRPVSRLAGRPVSRRGPG
ncbi:hypothetical protein SUDANB135_06582 [Streptomyces sp. SudanB135_2055]